MKNNEYEPITVTLESGKRVLQPGTIRHWAGECKCGQVVVERQVFPDAVKWWVRCDDCHVVYSTIREEAEYLEVM